MLKKAIELARAIVNLEVFDISENHQQNDGTVDLCGFFGEKIMRFADEYHEKLMAEQLTEFMIWYEENKSESLEKTSLDVINQYIQEFVDRKSSDEITM